MPFLQLLELLLTNLLFVKRVLLLIIEPEKTKGMNYINWYVIIFAQNRIRHNTEARITHFCCISLEKKRYFCLLNVTLVNEPT